MPKIVDPVGRRREVVEAVLRVVARPAGGLVGAMLLTYGLSAAFATATARPRLPLLRDPLVSGVLERTVA